MRGQAFGIGQLVRRKLRPAERKLGKLSPFKSRRYEVVRRKGVTYWCKPVGVDGPVIQRHFDDLEPAPEAIMSWEIPSVHHQDNDSESEVEFDLELSDKVSEADDESEEESEVEVIRRYPSQTRRKVRHLSPDPQAKKYLDVEYSSISSNDEL